MTAFKRGSGWHSKFQLDHRQHWVPGGPWKTKRQAEEAERRYRDKLRAHRTDETCASFATRWLEEWPRGAASTRRTYAYAIEKFKAEFGPTRLGDVERLSARTWALSVPRQVSKVVAIMFEDARNVGLIEHNPFSNLRLPHKKGTKVLAPTMDEYRALVQSATVLGGYGAEFRAMIQFSAWTGLRIGELHALQWDDLSDDMVHVRRSRKRDGSLGLPKNGEEREIVLTPPARVLDTFDPRADSPFVFHSPQGQPLLEGAHYYAWRQVRATAGLPHMRWHALRHFAATQLRERGVDPYAIAWLLGHRDGGTLVIERYGSPSEEMCKRRVLEAFEVDVPATSSERREAM